MKKKQKKKNYIQWVLNTKTFRGRVGRHLASIYIVLIKNFGRQKHCSYILNSFLLNAQNTEPRGFDLGSPF
jgi:hypothetical protein